jgi:hypothetical protein
VEGTAAAQIVTNLLEFDPGRADEGGKVGPFL